MGTSKLLWGQPDKILGDNLQWTSSPSRRSRNTPSHFILQQSEISTGTDGPSGSPITIGATFTYVKRLSTA